MLKRRSTITALVFALVLVAGPQRAIAGEARVAWIVSGAALGWAMLWAIPFAVSFSKGPYAYEPLCDGVPILDPSTCTGVASKREKDWVAPLAAASGVCLGAGIVVGFFSLTIASTESCQPTT